MTAVLSRLSAAGRRAWAGTPAHRLAVVAAVAIGLGSGFWLGAAADAQPPSPSAAPQHATTIRTSFVRDGADLDGDGRLDIALPVGDAVRGVDAYGSGAFGASRDGGRRAHRGVDFVAAAGDAVRAPIAGVVTQIGPAYAGEDRLLYVEIVNPLTGYTARVFYVSPRVRPGEAVDAGTVIGRAQDLAARYPAGMTNHVHVEFTGRRGARLDPLAVLPLAAPTVAEPRHG